MLLAPIPFPALSVVDVEYVFPLEIAVTPAIANASPNVVVHPRYDCPEAALAAHVYCTPLYRHSVKRLHNQSMPG